jgi:hypothetical protein
MKYAWFADNIDTKSPTYLHQVFAYGDIGHIIKLRDSLIASNAKDIFVSNPQKVYTKSRFNFIKNFILYINEDLDADKYYKDTPRDIG